MPKRILVIFLLVLVLLTACGGSSAADIAVCEAYQALVDAWPSDSDDVSAEETAIDIWARVSAAAEDLLATAEDASNGELRETALEVGDWADTYFEDNQDYAVGQGFIPFITESFVPGGETMSAQCEDLGNSITY